MFICVLVKSVKAEAEEGCRFGRCRTTATTRFLLVDLFFRVHLANRPCSPFQALCIPVQVKGKGRHCALIAGSEKVTERKRAQHGFAGVLQALKGDSSLKSHLILYCQAFDYTWSLSDILSGKAETGNAKASLKRQTLSPVELECLCCTGGTVRGVAV